MEPLEIRMLGEFSIRAGENAISDAGNRTKKVWALLAYLICHRGRPVSQRKLIELLWGEDPASANPENTLRITFHRTRTLLNQLWPNAGHELILNRESGYAWNDAIPFTLDADRFEALCTDAEEDAAARLENCRQALALYKGDFLEKQSSETWVIPVSTHYHNLYVSTAMEAAELLSRQERHAEAAAVCQKAIAAEPYHEPLHRLLIRELAAAGDQKGAAAVYENLSRRLFDDFGIRPNDETRAVYRQAVHSPSQEALPMDVVLEHLQEPEAAAGAMECDYDYFKVLCYAEARAMVRRGTATHILLLSLQSPASGALSRRSRNRIMTQLGQQIRRFCHGGLLLKELCMQCLNASAHRFHAKGRCNFAHPFVLEPRVEIRRVLFACLDALRQLHAGPDMPLHAGEQQLFALLLVALHTADAHRAQTQRGHENHGQNGRKTGFHGFISSECIN